MTPEKLQALLDARSEDEHLEFKEARNRFDFEELVCYCVALANEGGGMIIFGVTNTPPRRVLGTKAFDVPERTVAGIHERIRIKVIWHEVAHIQGRVLAFEIPPRPIGQPLQYDGRYLMRAGEALVPMTPDQLKRILDEARPDFSELPAQIGCDEADIVTLLDVQSYFDLKKRPLPSTRKEALETFVQKGLIRAEGGAFTITNLGALLFAKRLSDLRDIQSPSQRRQGCYLAEGLCRRIRRIDSRHSRPTSGERGHRFGSTHDHARLS